MKVLHVRKQILQKLDHGPIRTYWLQGCESTRKRWKNEYKWKSSLALICIKKWLHCSWTHAWCVCWRCLIFSIESSKRYSYIWSLEDHITSCRFSHKFQRFYHGTKYYIFSFNNDKTWSKHSNMKNINLTKMEFILQLTYTIQVCVDLHVHSAYMHVHSAYYEKHFKCHLPK